MYLYGPMSIWVGGGYIISWQAGRVIIESITCGGFLGSYVWPSYLGVAIWRIESCACRPGRELLATAIGGNHVASCWVGIYRMIVGVASAGN